MDVNETNRPTKPATEIAYRLSGWKWKRKTLSESEYAHSITAFNDVEVMAKNRGVILRMENGSEFQIAIVKSR